MTDDRPEGQETPDPLSPPEAPAASTDDREGLKREVAASMEVENRFRNGASWFYWIAGFSLVNSIFNLTGSNWGGFLFGLGFTQVIDGFAQIMNHPLGRGIAFVIDLLVIAFYVGFGYLAHQRHRWAFVVGMGAYVLDGLLFLLIGYWVGILFHIFAMVGIVRGYTALKQLEVIEGVSTA